MRVEFLNSLFMLFKIILELFKYYSKFKFGNLLGLQSATSGMGAPQYMAL